MTTLLFFYSKNIGVDMAAFVTRCARGLSSSTAFSSGITSISKQATDAFIVGAGCIGQSLAVSLLKSNSANRVFLQTKPHYSEGLQKSGITTKGAVEGTFKPNDKFRVVDVIDKKLFEEHRISQHPIIFSATKATQAVASLLPFHGINNIWPTVICLQNGIGSEQEVQKSVLSRRGSVLKGHVLGAAHQKESHLFAYKGQILVEKKDKAVSKTLKEMFRDQDSSIFSLEISENIYKAIYPKIAVNCVCNPLTIILNQNLGVIRERYESLIRMICHEIYTVASAQGVDLVSEQNLAEFVLNMMSQFSNHYSSMYGDHVAGKETEIDYINGGILQIAKKHGVEVPINRFLTMAIKEIYEKRALVQSVDEFYQAHNQYLRGLIRRLENLGTVRSS